MVAIFRKIGPLSLALATFLCLPALLGGEQTMSWPEGKLIKDLSLQNADIHSTLRFLSEYSGVNIVAGPTVEGSITLQLQDVTWKQVLDLIAKTNGLVTVPEEGYIRVMPQQDYIELEMAKGKYQADKESVIPLETKIFDVDNATASDLSSSLRALTSKRGRIDIDQRTNSLIIQDLPENIDVIAQMIGILDVETPQIRIEAKLLEIDVSALFELGIDWQSSDHPEGDWAASQKTIETNLAAKDVIGKFTYGTIQDNVDINATIAALMGDEKAEILAHPEITTVDNREASIHMGQEIPLKQFDEAGNVVIRMYEVGTKLTVTPHITSEDRILMHLKPERSSYTFDPNGVIINTQKAETNVFVSNGQTAVIGGLTNQEKRNIQKGLPILKDIPLLGALFRYTKHQTVTNDLVIFVTPWIVEKVTRAESGLESK